MKRLFGMFRRESGQESGRESGQGTIEYLLALLIAIILIGSFVYQFNSAFRQYAEAYFGGYVACLIETGELPGMTGGQCQVEEVAFNLDDGKQAISPDGIQGGSGEAGDAAVGANSAGNGEDEQNSSAEDNVAAETSSPELLPSGAKSATASTTVGGLSSRRRRVSTSVGTLAKSEADAAESESINALLGGASSSATDIVGNVNPNSRDKRVLMRGFDYWGSEADSDRALERPAVASVGEGDASNQLRPKVARVEPFRGPTQAIDNDDMDHWSVGNLVRWLFIAIIAIAIVVFFGGQVIQISKSWEK